MNDDLISRKEALEILFKDGEWNCDVRRSYERIKNLPTAYDVDLVSDEILYIFHDEIGAVFEESDGEGTTKKIDWILKMYKKINDVVKNGRIN